MTLLLRLAFGLIGGVIQRVAVALVLMGGIGYGLFRIAPQQEPQENEKDVIDVANEAMDTVDRFRVLIDRVQGKQKQKNDVTP